MTMILCYSRGKEEEEGFISSASSASSEEEWQNECQETVHFKRQRDHGASQECEDTHSWTLWPYVVHTVPAQLVPSHSNQAVLIQTGTSSSVITSRCWGFQWRPGGSTLEAPHSAGCCWSPSDGLWWTGSSSSRSPRSQHASPGWARSSLLSPAGVAGSSLWDRNTRIMLDYRCIWRKIPKCRSTY